jgi:hypothetical protein
MYKTDFAKRLAILAVPFIAIAGSAFAQPLSVRTNYDVKNMSFDRWCQEAKQYPAGRCDARRPEDVKAFENYRAIIERYELDYQKRVQHNEELQTNLNRDPTQIIQNRQDALP